MASIYKSRGMRNNNPLNVKYNIHNRWYGQGDPDSDGFCTFSKLDWGIRAAMKIIIRYQEHYKIFRVSDLIARWSPDGKTIVGNYTSFVERALGSKTFDIKDEESMVKLVSAMARFECGSEANIDWDARMVYTHHFRGRL